MGLGGSLFGLRSDLKGAERGVMAGEGRGFVAKDLGMSDVYEGLRVLSLDLQELSAFETDFSSCSTW